MIPKERKVVVRSSAEALWLSQVPYYLVSFIPFCVAFAIGSGIGSFLNVCILRLPAGGSLLSPPSRCPKCRKRLKWYDNIPLVSWLLLQGRCRNCRKPISWQYPLVEGFTGLFFALAFWKFGDEPLRLAFVLFLGTVSILLSGIDVRTLTLPDQILFPCMTAALLTASFNPWLGDDWKGRWSSLVPGFLVGGGFLWAFSLIGARLFKREAIGGGDIKLLAALGMYLGWEPAVNGLFLGSVLCALWGGTLLALGRVKPKTPLPYGPFLCAGCLLVLFVPQAGLTGWMALR